MVNYYFLHPPMKESQDSLECEYLCNFMELVEGMKQ